MRQITLLFLSLYFIIAELSAQTKIAAVKLNNKWGFIDEKGQTIIPFEYDDANNFSCGIAMVKKGFTWFYINLKNENIVKGKPYRCLSEFNSNRAIVFDSTLMKKVIIDKRGEIIPTNSYIDNIDHFSNGYARMRRLKEDEDNKLDVPNPHDIVYGYLDTNGVTVVKPIYRHMFSFTQNKRYPLGFVRRDVKLNKVQHASYWYYVRPDGTELNCPIGYSLREFKSPTDPLKPYAQCNDDSAYVMVRKDVQNTYNTATYFGFMNQQGKVVIEPKYLKAGNFNEGLAAVSEDGKLWGFINYDGQYIFTPRYTWVSDFNDGIAVVMDDYPKYMNKEGVYICTGPEEQKKVVYNSYTLPPTQKNPFSNGIALRQKGLLYGYINKNCEVKVPYMYSDGKAFSNGLAAVKTKDGWGYIDAEGTVIIPTKYQAAKSFVSMRDQITAEDTDAEFKEPK